ncbi:MAG: hypothetical protein U5J99_08425 [Parvularculaceae bacterium]|nr:hypothetical protein [Parvularculaceae bacterium]
MRPESLKHRAAILPAISSSPSPAMDATARARSDFEMGYEAGADAKSGEVHAALAALVAAKQEIDARVATLEARYRQRCAATLAEIISAAAPAICEAAAREAIAGVFNGAAAPPALVLRASPDVLDAIKGAVTETLSTSLTIDDGLAPGTVQARWGDGGLDCHVGQSLFAIVEFLNAQSSDYSEEPRNET